MSGIIGAVIGACATFFSVWLQLTKQAKLATRERLIAHTDAALGAIHAIQHRIPYLPHVNKSGFGYKNQSEVEASRATLRSEIAALKPFLYLLPQEIRAYWNEWLLCIADISVARDWDDVAFNRAICDVEAFTAFTIDILDKFKSDEKLPEALKRPYLLRESPDVWDARTGLVLKQK